MNFTLGVKNVNPHLAQSLNTTFEVKGTGKNLLGMMKLVGSGVQVDSQTTFTLTSGDDSYAMATFNSSRELRSKLSQMLNMLGWDGTE